MTSAEGIPMHEAFWRGNGPCLILIPAGQAPQYDTENYARRFDDPTLMWEAEMRRARAVVDWPTDGIPTVRPNLGVIFIPGTAGQSYVIQEDQMPWPGRPLSREEIQCLPSHDLEHSGMMSLAKRFYEAHRASGEMGVLAYHPDTQGVFSLAHLFYGDRIFTDLVDDPDWVHDLLEITVGIHIRVIRTLKALIGESDGQMAHGHSFPRASGSRMPGCGSAKTQPQWFPRVCSLSSFCRTRSERSSHGADVSSITAAGTRPCSRNCAACPPCAQSTWETPKCMTLVGFSNAVLSRELSCSAPLPRNRVKRGNRTCDASRGSRARHVRELYSGRSFSPIPTRNHSECGRFGTN